MAKVRPKETLKQRQAFEAWVRLGEGRSFSKLEQLLSRPRATLHNWSKRFDWAERAKTLDEGEKKKALALYSKQDSDETVREIEALMGRLSALIDSCFKMENGKPKPIFSVKTTKDFTSLITAQKDLIMLHKDLTELGDTTGGKKPKLGKIADMITVILGGMDDKEKLAFLDSDAKAVDGGGSGRSQGPVSDADFEEVPDGAHPGAD